MSIIRHHNEWLTLVSNSGPFLSRPVLAATFPQGLHAHDANHMRRLRQAFNEWDDDASLHRQWVQFVLAETLGFETLLAEGQAIPQSLKSDVPEYGETLRPDFIVTDPATNKVRLLVQVYPRPQPLTKPVATSRWKTSPDTRMAQLLHDTGVRLGLVTNGHDWMLVNAPKNETTGYANWRADLWLEEPLTLRAFRTLLSSDRFFDVPDIETLDLKGGLLDQSQKDQQEVTDQLGYQVRKAVEVVIQALDKADQDHGRRLLAGVGEAVLYESALTVMMRLVFLFCAEERELLLLGDELYDKNYAVSTLREQLRLTADEHGEEILGLRFDAWTRLLTTFRAVYAGVRHDRLKLPAYGGSLFNPDRFAFLEGRPAGTHWRTTAATPLPVSNRTVLHLLEALQVLRTKVGKTTEARPVSFRLLEIEQIGHVYEGLLDHTARRATEPMLGLAGTRHLEPEIAVSRLEALAEKGESALLKFLKDETGKSESALKKLLAAVPDDRLEARFRTACQGAELWARVRPFAGLVRLDTVEYPVVVTVGSVFVAAGSDRRSTGTHYTPKSLTEPIVRYTLEPLVYDGPADGKPNDEWTLRSPGELLGLKVCDIACGSGAFLVEACRYLATRLQEAWQELERHHPGELRISPDGTPSQGNAGEELIPADPGEREAYARRLVAQRCVYGVDKNPLAVEIAKLSLWLLTLAKDRPFEFLDHAIRHGDSLVGLHDLDQLRYLTLSGKREKGNLFLEGLDAAVNEAVALRNKLEARHATTIEAVHEQERYFFESVILTDRLKRVADVLIGQAFGLSNGTLTSAAVAFQDGRDGDLFAAAEAANQGRTPFHWPLEFPEVFSAKGGFDACIGNPPFVNAIEGRIDRASKDWLARLSPELGGTADYAYHFLARTNHLVSGLGMTGLLLPRSFLVAPAAARLRHLLVVERPPALIVAPESSRLFNAADVFVVAVVIGRIGACRGGRSLVASEWHAIPVNSENWWSTLDGAAVERQSGHVRMDQVFDVYGSMTTAMAYDIVRYIVDDAGAAHTRLVTTGLIEPGDCLWGRQSCRYLKVDYAHPTISSSADLPSDIAVRVARARRPKVLIAGLGSRVEAFFDASGEYCGTVQTFTITHAADNETALRSLCDHLNTTGVTQEMCAALGANAMGGGSVTMKKSFLVALELPSQFARFTPPPLANGSTNHETESAPSLFS